MKRKNILATALLIYALMALMVPNVVLCFTEPWPVAWKVAGILMPLGLYAAICGIIKRVGVTVWTCFPLWIFGAFQLVLTYLYGESIIAVDMFLNVVTTNVNEASALLANLAIAIAAVVVIYVPLLVWGAVAWRKGSVLPFMLRRWLVRVGLILFAVGMLFTAPSMGRDWWHKTTRRIFPVNVTANLVEAFHRQWLTEHYPERSAAFTYHAQSEGPADEREIYVLVIGESSRTPNWQLAGYPRPTNPGLSKVDGLAFFPKALSESNTTHKSVPMIISGLHTSTFGDSIYVYKSILTAMKEAGFYTRFFSNQAPNNSFTQFFGDEADDTRYTDALALSHPYDAEMLPWLREAVADTLHPRQFIVMHTYGSHFRYRDRYPASAARFLPCNRIDANAANRRHLINAYDNAILNTDRFLTATIEALDSADIRAAMLYSADHGEDIFDDARHRFLHASPVPTYWQIHVPVAVWTSDTLRAESPAMAAALRANTGQRVSPQKSMFNTAMQLARVSSPIYDPTLSLASSTYSPLPPVYVTDRNDALPLLSLHLRPIDITLLTPYLK